MRKRNLFYNIAERLHYILLAIFTIFSNIFSTATIFRVLAVLTLVYIAAFELYQFLKKKNARRHSESFIELLNFSSQERLMDFPLPIVVTDKDGDIIWYNEPFVTETEGADLSKFDSVYRLSKDILNKKHSKIYFADKYFSVTVDKCQIRGRDLCVLYFFDITDYQKLQIRYNQQKPVIAHILIDNYDELFQLSKESEKSTAMAVIDNALSDWAQKFNGIIRKTEKDRYLFIFKNEHLKTFTENRFDILDTIRNLDIDLTTAPTISIGVGFGSDIFAENEEFARQALDMALSRGGDQASIKSAQGFEFFGGLGRGSEKRTKVKSRVIATQLRDLLKKVDTVLVMGHRAEDFDALGACVGIARIGLVSGKKVGIIYNEETGLAQSLYDKLKVSKDMKDLFVTPEQALIMAGPTSVIVIVDTHNAAITSMPKILEYAPRKVVIDHHRKVPGFIDDAEIFFHDTQASSACEMIAGVMQYMNINRMPAIEAEALLAGIFLDTKQFTVKTTLQTFDASSYLRRMGADTTNVKRLFQVDMDTYTEKADLVQKAKVYRNVIAIAASDKIENSQFRIPAAQAADEMLNIENVQAAFTLFKSDNNEINVSGRSYGQVNVQLIAEKLGGGGHQTTAGAQLKGISVSAALEKLKKAIDEYIEESNLLAEK